MPHAALAVIRGNGLSPAIRPNTCTASYCLWAIALRSSGTKAGSCCFAGSADLPATWLAEHLPVLAADYEGIAARHSADDQQDRTEELGLSAKPWRMMSQLRTLTFLSRNGPRLAIAAA